MTDPATQQVIDAAEQAAPSVDATTAIVTVKLKQQPTQGQIDRAHLIAYLALPAPGTKEQLELFALVISRVIHREQQLPWFRRLLWRVGLWLVDRATD